MERIDKVLSNLGILSRSECKKAIKKGLIKINGSICKSAEAKIDPDIDQISYNGEIIASKSFVYYMLNKPAGYITARKDDSQPVVFDLINDSRKDLAAIGRLDKDTTGLLIITNDGQTNHYLLSPKHHISKKYEVLVEGHLSTENIELLCSGVDIGDDTPTLPAEVEILSQTETTSLLSLSIVEGRYHQVKRMLSAVNHPVIKLHRSEFGMLKLDSNLAPGEYRELTDDELKILKQY